jgi:hypothetical protein
VLDQSTDKKWNSLKDVFKNILESLRNLVSNPAPDQSKLITSSFKNKLQNIKKEHEPAATVEQTEELATDFECSKFSS